MATARGGNAAQDKEPTETVELKADVEGFEQSMAEATAETAPDEAPKGKGRKAVRHLTVGETTYAPGDTIPADVVKLVDHPDAWTKPDES
jgi:hypothetical protein